MMPRSKDDRFFVKVALDLPGHRKLVDATAATKWLNVCGFIVARREQSDGIVRPSVVVAEADVPPRHAADLVKRNVWHEPGHDCDRCIQPPPGHAVIHDYLDHQQSRDEITDSRRKKSEAGKKGAKARWGDGTSHSTSHGTPHENRIWQTDGKGMADTEQSKNNVVAISSQSSLVARELDDDGLTRIRQALNGCPEAHARKTAAFVLAKAPADVRNPTAYVLAAIADEPEAYRYRRGNPKKANECPTHAGQWADHCAGCAADRKAGNA